MPREQIDILLNLVPDHPTSVLRALETQAHLAQQKDQHGYSLLHAAASYGHIDLIRKLIQRYSVDPNITDEDGETPIFAAELPDVARVLLDLGTDATKTNDEGLTAEQKIDAEGEYPLVGAFLRNYTPGAPQVNGNSHIASTSQAETATTEGQPSAPSNTNATSLPSQDIRVTSGYIPDPNGPDNPDIGEADPEIRRRIEELAAREDFDTPEVQRQLRDLVTDVVGGLRRDAEGAEDGGDRSRRRVAD